MIGNNKIMDTLLITGINGYLGSELANKLSESYKIIGLEYSRDNLFRIEDKDYPIYSVVNNEIDLLFDEQQIDIIIHAATFYGRNNETLETIAKANTFVPFQLLDKAISNGTRLFVNTDTVLDRFVNTYALTKKQFHDWLFLRKNEIKVINMQLEHFYGPNAATSNFISAMIEKMQNNVESIDLTLGEQERDFIYIDDVISAYEHVLYCSDELIEDYTIFQVANGDLVKIKDLLELIKNKSQSSSILNFGVLPYRENELMKSTTDNLALKNLGWYPKVSIAVGLEIMLDSK